jgi:hypothetical protein
MGGLDETLWIDIHGPNDEIDAIKHILVNNDVFAQIVQFKQDNLSKGDSKLLESLLQDECGKLFTKYKKFGIHLNCDLLLKFCDLDFGPLGSRGEFTRKNKNYLYVFCSYTYRGSYPKTAESIKELSKHFPNTMFRYTCEDEDGGYDLFICRYVNGSHSEWSNRWSTWEKWHGWPTDVIRERNEKRERSKTITECGCEAFSMPCEYASRIYDCGLEVLGVNKEVADIFEKRGVKVNKNREGLFIRFQYAKDPIKLMEWLSAKYKDCIFVCEYSNTQGIQCVWTNYRAIHYPYVLKKL